MIKPKYQVATQNKGTGFDHEAASPPRGKNYLLVIAIDEYVHCHKLSNCVKDAQDLIEVLTTKYQFEASQILTLFNEEATRPNIHTQFKALKGQVNPEDNLLVYFSGHGETEDNVGYWVPANAHPQREWEYFSTDEIKRRLEAINSFHTFVIVDACFSGSLFSSYKSATPGYETKRSRWGLAASHSRERALDGTPGENSPFATTLLHQLKGSQENLSIQELAATIIRRVGEATEGRQTPVFKPLNVKGDDAGQYVFRLRQATPAWQNAWAAIERLPEESISQLNTKILCLDEYAEQFPSATNVSQALVFGERLEQKREFLQAGDSLFRLRDFSRKDTPFRQQALERIKELKKGYSQPAEPEPEPRAVQPRKQQAREKPPQPPRTPSLQGKQPEPAPPNTFTDPRDGQVYRTVELNGQRWMAQNLNYDVGEGCWVYEKSSGFLGLGAKIKKEGYGRLYTWEAAKKACPPGWRLPTDEEWRALAMAHGGLWDGEDKGDPKKAYSALLEGGSSGFAALLGGYRYTDGSFGKLGDYVNYWSATEYGSDYAWYYYFNGYNGKLGRYNYLKAWGFSCRCVQDLTI